MKKVSKTKQHWRVVRTSRRESTTQPAFLKGLQLGDDPENIDVACVSDVDGFIIYSGLWRKDWSLINTNIGVVDNITTVTVANTVECSA